MSLVLFIHVICSSIRPAVDLQFQETQLKRSSTASRDNAIHESKPHKHSGCLFLLYSSGCGQAKWCTVATLLQLGQTGGW